MDFYWGRNEQGNMKGRVSEKKKAKKKKGVVFVEAFMYMEL